MPNISKTIWKWLQPSPFKAGCLVVVLALALFLHNDAAFQSGVRSLDNRIVDWMFRCRGASPTSGQVVIVDIDEKSLEAVGQWPWPRNRFAELLLKIGQYQPRVVGLDMCFAEPDRTSPRHYLPLFKSYLKDDINLSESQLDYDVQLGQSIGRIPLVLGYVFQMENDGTAPGEERPFPMCNIQLTPPGAPFEFARASRVILNLPEISQNPLSEGHFNVFPDASGTVRKVPLLIEYLGMPYPSLALEMVREGLKAGIIAVESSDQGILGVRLADRFIPTGHRTQVTLNWRGEARTFPYLSAADILEGRLDQGQLNGKYVLIGCSAAGLHDLRTSPISSVIPGVEIHATLVDNLLNADPFRYNPKTEAVLVLLVLAIGGLLLSAILAYASPLIGFAVGLAMLLLITLGNYFWIFRQGLIMGVTFPLATVLLIMVVVSISNYFFEGREKKFIRHAFGHYVSDGVVAELVRNPRKLSLAGQEKTLSVMFSDIRGFTNLSEQMSPTQLSTFLNEYLTAMTDQAMQLKGTIDKFIGDAIMAIWGAPVSDPDHAANAVRCSLRMMQTLNQLQPAWVERGLPAIDIGIGINTGPMTVGNMGSQSRFDYTVIGDNVNLASRLEGLNKVYGTNILISEHTRQAIGEGFVCRYVDRVRVKGKDKPIRIYEPLNEGTVPARLAAAVKQFEAAATALGQRRFEHCRELLLDLKKHESHPLYDLYLTRVEEYLAVPPPPDWDGVCVHKTK